MEARVAVQDGRAAVAWGDGHEAQFRALRRRDRCARPESRLAATGRRPVESGRIPDGSRGRFPVPDRAGAPAAARA